MERGHPQLKDLRQPWFIISQDLWFDWEGLGLVQLSLPPPCFLVHGMASGFHGDEVWVAALAQGHSCHTLLDKVLQVRSRCRGRRSYRNSWPFHLSYGV
jgi:hypothetical protein